MKRQVSPEFRKMYVNLFKEYFCCIRSILRAGMLHACRLDECQRQADNAAYAKLVKDVTPTDIFEENGPVLPTTRLQIGQGVHMVVTMGLGYALGSQFGGSLGIHIPVLVRPPPFHPSTPTGTDYHKTCALPMFRRHHRCLVVCKDHHQLLQFRML